MARETLTTRRGQGSDGTGSGIDVEFLKRELSDFEKTVLLLLVRGYLTREIARETALSVDYIYTLLHLLRAAFHTRTNAGVVACAFISGLLDRNGRLRPPKSSGTDPETVQ